MRRIGEGADLPRRSKTNGILKGPNRGSVISEKRQVGVTSGSTLSDWQRVSRETWGVGGGGLKVPVGTYRP